MSTHDLFIAKIALVNMLRQHSDQLRGFIEKITQEMKKPLQDFEKEELLNLYQVTRRMNLQTLDEIDSLVKNPQKGIHLVVPAKKGG